MITCLCRYALLPPGGHCPSLPVHLRGRLHHILRRRGAANQRHGLRGQQRFHEVKRHNGCLCDSSLRPRVRYVQPETLVGSGVWLSWGVWSQWEDGITGRSRWTTVRNSGLALRPRTRRGTRTSAPTTRPGVWDTFSLQPGNKAPAVWTVMTLLSRSGFWRPRLWNIEHENPLYLCLRLVDCATAPYQSTGGWTDCKHKRLDGRKYWFCNCINIWGLLDMKLWIFCHLKFHLLYKLGRMFTGASRCRSVTITTLLLEGTTTAAHENWAKNLFLATRNVPFKIECASTPCSAKPGV